MQQSRAIARGDDPAQRILAAGADLRGGDGHGDLALADPGHDRGDGARDGRIGDFRRFPERGDLQRRFADPGLFDDIRLLHEFRLRQGPPQRVIALEREEPRAMLDADAAAIQPQGLKDPRRHLDLRHLAVVRPMLAVPHPGRLARALFLHVAEDENRLALQRQDQAVVGEGADRQEETGEVADVLRLMQHQRRQGVFRHAAAHLRHARLVFLEREVHRASALVMYYLFLLIHRM